MREGRDRGRKFRGVVVGADFRRQLAGHHRKARRGADRIVAIGVLENDPARRQTVDIRRFDQWVAVLAQSERRHLVGLYEQDVRLRIFAHRLPPSLAALRRADSF